jgi:Xaa-Pro dipeptidase
LLLNKTRAKQIMEKYHVDALVASTAENVTYLSDFRSIGQNFFGRAIFAILPADASVEPALVIAKGDTAAISIHPSWMPDVRFFGKYDITAPEGDSKLSKEESAAKGYIDAAWPKATDDSLSGLVRALEEKGLANKSIAIDEGGLTPASFEALKKKLPKTNWIFGQKTFKEIRMIKTHEEIAKLRRAAEIAQQGMEAALSEARPGIAENELAKIIYTSIIKNGGTAYFVNVHCGTKGSLCVREFTDYKLARGDVIYLDVGAKYRWYCGDTGVTAVLGTPTEEVRRTQKAIVAGEQRAIAQVRPGVKASEIYKTAISETRKNGLPHFNYHRAGHGIGLENSDLPSVSADDETALAKDMVLCVETPYLKLGLGGFQAEDTFLVKNDGVEWFTSGKRELREV